MIDIEEFLCSLKCTWVKKCLDNKIDNWRLDLNIATHNNPTTFSQFDEWTTSSSWAEGISISLESLKVCFSLLNDNFLHSSLYGNPLLINELRAKQKFNLNLIPAPNNNSWVNRRSLIISDFLDFEGNVLPVNITSNVLECNLDAEQYNLLKKAITDSKTWWERKKISINGITSSTLETFFQRFKKGSKPIRKIFEHVRNEKIKVRNRQNIKTFFRLTGIRTEDVSVIESCCKIWTFSFFENKAREFLFKFYNNLLGLNVRVSHFNNNIGRGCTFCTLKNADPVPDETFLHLFFDCPESYNLRNGFLTNFVPEFTNTTRSEKIEFYFLSVNPLTTKNDNFFLTALTCFFNYFIWTCKLQKTLPNLNALATDIFFKLKTLRKNNTAFRSSMQLNLQLCRDWNLLARGRH
jgi:hypothetical protein